MNRKRFLKEVLRQDPTLGVAGQFLYVRPVGHVLCGFVGEVPPSGIFVWHYSVPLYDYIPFLHLTFGKRLAAGADLIDPAIGNEVVVATEFLRRIEKLRPSIAALSTPGSFAEYIEREIGLVHPAVIRSYAFSLVLLDRTEEAEGKLRELLHSHGNKMDQPSRSLTERVLYVLRESTDFAKAILLECERSNRERFGLQD